jgi:hypothetical protein
VCMLWRFCLFFQITHYICTAVCLSGSISEPLGRRWRKKRTRKKKKEMNMTRACVYVYISRRTKIYLCNRISILNLYLEMYLRTLFEFSFSIYISLVSLGKIKTKEFNCKTKHSLIRNINSDCIFWTFRI